MHPWVHIRFVIKVYLYVLQRQHVFGGFDFNLVRTKARMDCVAPVVGASVDFFWMGQLMELQLLVEEESHGLDFLIVKAVVN